MKNVFVPLLYASLMFFAFPASAQEPQTQKNTDGTTTATESYGKGGTRKTTENAQGEIVDIVTEEPDATYGAGGTKITIGVGQGPWGDPRTTIWVYKDKSGKVRRMEQNHDINGEDWIEFSIDYGADGRLTAYARQVHTGNPEEFPEGTETVLNFKYDKSGRPSTAATGPNSLETASTKADEILKAIRGATERQMSILDDLGKDFNMLDLSIDRADNQTAGVPTPSAGTAATNPGYGTSVPPPLMPGNIGIPWEIPPGGIPWEISPSSPWPMPPGGFPREIPPMKK
jgi:hypothetical protein